MTNPTIRRAGTWAPLIQQGSTFSRVLTFDWEGVDLTTYQFRGQIRRAHEDPEVLAAYTITATEPGRLEVSLTAAQTEALPAERLVHDIEMYTAQDAFVARIVEGRVTVTPEVTRGP